MYTDEVEYGFDEDEMAALEGQRLVAEFRCGIWLQNCFQKASMRMMRVSRQEISVSRQWIGSGHRVG